MVREAPNPTSQNQFYPFGERPMPKTKNGKPVNPAVVPLHDVAQLPDGAKFVVVGAGMHGMSTACHIAKYLIESGKGKGSDVVLIDKAGPGAGATGHCLRVRAQPLYDRSPCTRSCARASKVWKYDPVDFGFQQVGYVSAGEANQESDYEQDPQAARTSRLSLRSLHGQGRQGLPEEHLARLQHRRRRGGAARKAVGLCRHPQGDLPASPRNALQHGVRRCSGVEVHRLRDAATAASPRSRPTRATSSATPSCSALGAWTPKHWEMLGKPATARRSGTRTAASPRTRTCGPTGGCSKAKSTCRRRDYPHRAGPRSAGAACRADEHAGGRRETGKEFTDKHLYVYGRTAPSGWTAPGIQGGTIPIKIGPKADDRALRPRQRRIPGRRLVRRLSDFGHGPAHVGRFKGSRKQFRERRNGGIGAFTPDNVPIFDWVAPNVYMIADSQPRLQDDRRRQTGRPAIWSAARCRTS